ncbi:MAG: anaerobic sulfatase maturase [Anaerolineales bacterium]|nr:MAG: anaerobic sulfatase maturase [Anaerolineales bacterium]
MAQPHVPPRFQVLAKPSGASCNLACTYCFFLDKELLYPGSNFRMSADLLEAYIQQLISAHHTSEVTVSWQGGEPTLMGLDFFCKAVALQDKYRRPGMTFENTLQTNGTLLDDAWCEFFKEHNFLIGISLDGPRHIHDIFRVDRGGAPTFDRVMRGIRLLQKHRVEYNILATVNRISADHPKEIYQFLRDEVGTQWIQFIPVIERMNPDGRNLIQAGDHVSPRSVRPIQFGRFLIQVFDEWVQHDVGKIFVQTFEAALRNWMRLSTSGMCVFEKTCGIGLALEHNGDLYSCDHFVEPDYLLGNIKDKDMLELVGSAEQMKFGQDKFNSLPKTCLRCPVLFACNGECPKNRFSSTPAGEPGLNYLCAGYKAFFQHADEPMKVMALLMNDGRPASHVMGILAERKQELLRAYQVCTPEAACPCQSGLQYKECHGWSLRKSDRKRGSKPIGGPRSAVVRASTVLRCR